MARVRTGGRGMSGMLAPHEWDRFGYPPPVGEPYVLPDPEPDAGMSPSEKAVADLLDDAEYKLDEAESLRDESDDMFRDGRRLLDDAEAKLATLPKLIADKLRKRIDENKYR
jgi:hypothetical protein